MTNIQTKKRIIICFRILYAATSLRRQLWAIGLTFNPVASSIHTDESVDLDVVISGLESSVQRHSFKDLAAFKFSIQYDHTALNFHSYALRSGPGNKITDNTKGVMLNLPGGTAIPLSNLSCVWDFNFRSCVNPGLVKLSFFGSELKSDSLSFSNTSPDKDQDGVFSASWGYGADDIPEASEANKMLLLLNQ